MIFDARHDPIPKDGAEVCVIGGGPAGLVVADELRAKGVEVLLLESGGVGRDVDMQSLNDGRCEGDAYAGLRNTRHRGLGGTTRLWNTPTKSGLGAKYAPLSAIDFEPREGDPHGGWPFGLDALKARYERAQAICGLGPFQYSDTYWNGGRPPMALPEGMHAGVYQFGGAEPFWEAIPDRLRSASNVRLYHHATVTRLEAASRRVTRAWVGADGREPFPVEAERFVLAGGAVENARLLLCSPGANGVPLGDHSGWLGRCFMEHPRDRALTVEIDDDSVFEQLRFFDLHEATDGTWICGRIGIYAGVVRELGLPNASVTLLPLLREPKRSSRAAHWLRALKRRVGPTPQGHGWSRVKAPSRVYRGLQLLINTEQRPHRENRVLLGKERDRFGMPRAVLQWRWRSEEMERQRALRRFIAERVRQMGIGTVRVDESAGIDPNAHHHAGTTRMAEDPAEGVCDPSGRVYGVENLFVVGASVFPSAGWANPTLTVVGLGASWGWTQQRRSERISTS